MRTALGQPLQNISENILNRVVSKNIQADLRKFKMGKKDRGVSRDKTKSPNGRRQNFDDYDGVDTGNYGELSKEVSQYLGMISSSHGNK